MSPVADTLRIGKEWQAQGTRIWCTTPWNARVEIALVSNLAAANGIDCEKVAAVVAAAPKLLEACKRLVGCMNAAGWEGDSSTLYALEAISEATGETQ